MDQAEEIRRSFDQPLDESPRPRTLSPRRERVKEIGVPRPIRVAHLTTVDLTLRYLLRPQLQRLAAEGFDVTTISAPGEHARALEEEGIRHIAWPSATRGWSLGSDLKAFRELFRILRRERFDVVHTHNPKAGVLGRIAARLAGVPHVVNTQHGIYATPTDRPTRRLVVLAAEWLAARFSHLELYQSEEDFQWVQRLRLARPPKAVLLGNGVDVERFHPGAVPPRRPLQLRRELGIPEDALVVGTVGRLVAEKGYRELIDAAASVRSALPGTAFLVVGGADPEKWDSLPADLIERAARHHMIFAGHRDDVRDLLAVMDVFVLPSWREGLPRSAIEAAAMARPLVLTDIRGCREVARDGVEGLLVPARDALRLAEAITTLLKDPDLRTRMGAAARERALSRFDERRVEDIVVNEYRRMLSADASPTRWKPGDSRMRLARPGDVDEMVRLHRETVPTAFLPTLGDRFMRVLYRTLLKGPGEVAIVVEDEEGRVLGFAAGTVSVADFYRRFFRRAGLRAAFVAAPKLVRPRVVRHALETARYPGGGGSLPASEILVWGVDRAARSRGFGAALLEAMLRELGNRGAAETKIVVYAENERAGKVLTDTGWTVAAQITVHDGQSSNVWVHACPSSSHSE